jgi:hypothetical protein
MYFPLLDLQLQPASDILAIPTIPTLHARTGHIIPGFTNNLLRLGKLCDADCTAHLNKHNLVVQDHLGKTILHGKQEPTGACLWRVNIASPLPNPAPAPTPLPVLPPTQAPTPAQTKANRLKAHTRAYDLPSVPALIAYLHGTAGYPVKSSWLAAIKRGAYTSWPGLTYMLAARYCPEADETLRGHMAQPWQHI